MMIGEWAEAEPNWAQQWLNYNHRTGSAFLCNLFFSSNLVLYVDTSNGSRHFIVRNQRGTSLVGVEEHRCLLK